jgi:hypothetical protein
VRTSALAAAATLALLSLGVAGPAAGQERQPQVSVSPSSAEPGDEVLATLTGCDPAQRAQLALAIGPGGVVEQGNADADGRLRAALPVPENAGPGAARLIGQCQSEAGGTDSTAETTLAVAPSTPGRRGVAGQGELPITELPFTGPMDVVPEATVGFGLVALGTALGFAGRRREYAR